MGLLTQSVKKLTKKTTVFSTRQSVMLFRTNTKIQRVDPNVTFTTGSVTVQVLQLKLQPLSKRSHWTKMSSMVVEWQFYLEKLMSTQVFSTFDSTRRIK